MKMKHGMQVVLGPGHIALGGEPASPHGKEHSCPPFSKFICAGFACVRIICGPYLLWPNGWMDQDETWHGGRPRPLPHCVRCGYSSPSLKGAQWLMSVVAKWLDGSRCHLVGR